jgi:hypothetical protein
LYNRTSEQTSLRSSMNQLVQSDASSNVLLNIDLVRDAFPSQDQVEYKFSELEDKIKDEKDLLSIYKLLTRSLMAGKISFGSKDYKSNSNI